MRAHQSSRARPQNLSPAELGFRRQRAVSWLNPGVLISTAIRVVLAYLLGGYLDKRELQAALPARVHDYSDRDELWFDYAADIGDGFDAAYSVVHKIAQPTMAVGASDDGSLSMSLPRGEFLVLGGDEVYPVGSPQEYDNRWKGPYRAALPSSPPTATSPHSGPTIFALPGNHDWYDGLTSFLRVFAQQDRVGGWRTAQSRSYFAARLPHNWWLLAVDTQLDEYIDEPQLEYFEQVADDIGPNHRVIICVPRPSWVKAYDNPAAYDNLDYFIRTIVEPTHARIPAIIAGDLHHYARYSGDGPDGHGRELITCGGGGAYLVGTAHLPEEIEVPSGESVSRMASTSRPYRLAATFPSARRSRALDWHAFFRIPTRNPGFVGMLGLFQTLLMLGLLTADGVWGVDDWAINAPIGFGMLAVVAGTILFSTVMGDRGLRQWIAGFLHGVPHIALAAVGAALWGGLPFMDAPGPLPTLLAFVIYLPVIGLFDTWVLCAYLLVARYVRVNINELYAGMGLDDYRGFLRLHIDQHGDLTIYPLGVERIARRWRANPNAASEDAPWVIPVDPIGSEVVDGPITVR